jgi:hypothetical protein
MTDQNGTDSVPYFQAYFPYSLKVFNRQYGRHFSLCETRPVKISKQILFIGKGMMNCIEYLQKHAFYHNTVELHLQPPSKIYGQFQLTHEKILNFYLKHMWEPPTVEIIHCPATAS